MYIIISLLVIIVLYLIISNITFVAFVDHMASPPNFIKPVYNDNGCWTVFASEEVLSIPTGQWREVPTNFDITTVSWYIRGFKLLIFPFGNVGIRVHPLDSRAAKGLLTHAYIARAATYMGQDNNIPIILYNNGAYPVRIRRGDPIAQVEFFKIKKVVVYHIQKLK
jgi:hypothetical protein